MRRLHQYLSCIVILGLLTLTACDSGDKRDSSRQSPSGKPGQVPGVEVPDDPVWAEYVARHTSGSISKRASIQIDFVRDLIEETQIGTDASAVVEISPDMTGKIEYSGRREITISPESALEPGAQYQVRILSSQIATFPASLGDYEFEFSVLPKDLEVRVLGMSSTEDTVMVTGQVVTSDYEDSAVIEQILKVQVDGQEISLDWDHGQNGTYHEWVARSIQRGTTEQTLQIIWDAEPLDLDRKGMHPLPIPPKGQFKVTGVSAVGGQGAESGATRYIQVRFSEPLDTNQNLKGLIQLGSAAFSTRIEGNILKIYPASAEPGAYTVTIEPGIKTSGGSTLKDRLQKDIYFEMQDPGVRFVGKGVILPDNPVLSVPFEAINVKSVKVTAFRIYEDNVGQFLQNNKLGGDAQLGRVGRYLWRKTIDLGQVQSNSWNRFALDATELLKSEPGALFRLTLSIDRSDSILECTEADKAKPIEESHIQDYDDINLSENSGWDYADYYYNENYWQDRRNPCKDEFYKNSGNASSHRNFMSSNLALMAKRGAEGSIRFVATDIRTATPVSGVSIDVRNFQDQSLGNLATDAEGFAQLNSDTAPFYVIANKGKEYAYLKVNAATALPLSHFDVGGDQVKQGVKGNIYGERGVWRPGDNIYLTFVLEDKNGVIPDDHPVTMQLYDPKGQLSQTRTNTSPVNGFYTFRMKTADDAITGNWTAKALLGGTTFTKTIKVETVIPNRLRIETTFENEALAQSDMPARGHVFAQWLHGADAKNLKSDVSVRLTPARTKFTRNSDYTFDDPARKFRSEPVVIFEGNLDSTGNRDFDARIEASQDASGMLTANFTTRVFEEGGAFSTSQSSTPYHPYDHYVGIKVPEGDAARNMLLTDTSHTVEIASLDKEGEPVSLPAVEISVYKISWRWWWDASGDDDLANYVRSSYQQFVHRDMVKTTDGSGQWQFDIKYPDWGRYLVRACDLNGGHCASKIVYIDWPGWAGRARETGGAGANALTLQSDKQDYKVGETATVSLPPATSGRALISIETGSKILRQQWHEFSDQSAQYSFKLTEQMSPNAYVSVTLIQPHDGKDNDRPIRLYGVIPVNVENPKTRLEPELILADEWTPASNVTVEVKESKGRAMTYTLAVVDEGLLGLTSFRTPNLHNHFYRKEALGVLTWDMFDEVTGAYGGELERLLSLGGDEEAEEDDQASDEEKRFPPVVRFLGPFTLKSGSSNKHEIDIPQYIGAVRVMLVAGSEKDASYGSTHKSVFVRGSISMLPTVPRVVGPEEEFSVPVAVFTMRDDIKEVKLTTETSSHFEITGPSSQTLRFDAPGEQPALLRFRVSPEQGKGRLKFMAVSGEYTAESEIFIDIRGANPVTTRQFAETINSGKDWKQQVVPHGIAGTNRIALEVSSIPPINLNRRLNYLIRYPHGCLEQVTSSVFPQLYLPALVKLSPERKEKVQSNIDAAIERLRRFQKTNGAFSYWPGGWGNNVNDWANNYAGHFLVEARKQGYHIPPDMMDNWVSYQTEMARNWVTGAEDSRAAQVYRLYTLALASQPELAAMNRLRENAELTSLETWQLAAAYALAGLKGPADELANSVKPRVSSWDYAGLTFGSSLRDQAIFLDASSILGREDRAEDFVDDISDQLYADKWHSTQSVAFSLSAIARFVAVDRQEEAVTFDWRVGAKEQSNIKMQAPVYEMDILDFPAEGADIFVENNSNRKLFASILSEGMPKAGDEQAHSSGIRLDVKYRDKDGNSLDVRNLPQGQDFVVVVSVRNLNDHKLENVALTHVVPPGWEIHNNRLSGESPESASIDYQDIRDDRVLTYFGLNMNETKEFSVRLTATYLGRYYQPGVHVEAMYDGDKNARTKGQWVEVTREQN